MSRFGRRESLPRWRENTMTNDELMGFNARGGSFRSAPGAPNVRLNADPSTGLVGELGGSGSTEDSWRKTFGRPQITDDKTGRAIQPWGLQGKQRGGLGPLQLPIRPAPQVAANPNIIQVAKTDAVGPIAPGYVAPPPPAETLPARGGWLSPTQAYPAPIGSSPDLSTPQGLMAHAAQTSQAYLAQNAPAQITTGSEINGQYGKGFARNSSDSTPVPDWGKSLPTI